MSYGDGIKNALIESTMLGWEDHGILTAYVTLNYGGSGQAFGGWALDNPVKDASDKFIGRFGTAEGMQFVERTMKAIGATSWEKLKGLHCRVEVIDGRIARIGHIIRDDWFEPAKLFEKL